MCVFSVFKGIIQALCLRGSYKLCDHRWRLMGEEYKPLAEDQVRGAVNQTFNILWSHPNAYPMVVKLCCTLESQ